MLIYWRRVSLQKDELWRSSWDLTGKSMKIMECYQNIVVLDWEAQSMGGS